MRKCEMNRTDEREGEEKIASRSRLEERGGRKVWLMVRLKVMI